MLQNLAMLGVIFNLIAAVLIDEPLLSNVRQLTFEEMGFEKAGEGYFSPDGKSISFQAVPIGKRGFQIFTIDLETGELQKISGDFPSCTCSFFHPKEKRILFAASPLEPEPPLSSGYKWELTRYMNLYESDFDGGNLVQLTEGSSYHAECAYSPDGESIVFASDEDGSMNLYTIKRDGSFKKQLTYSQGCYNGGSFFSPDGKTILFRSDRETPNLLQVYQIDLDGGNLTQLTDNPYVNWAPFWHPSGEAVAYTTSKHGHHNYQIYLLFPKTGKEVRLTGSSTFDGLPSFNREGTQLVWTSKRGGKNAQLFMANFELPLEE